MHRGRGLQGSWFPWVSGSQQWRGQLDGGWGRLWLSVQEEASAVQKSELRMQFCQTGGTRATVDRSHH